MIPIKTHLRYAAGFMELGMLDDARKEIDALPEEDRTLPDVLTVRLELHRMAKQWEEMAQVARQLRDKQPENPEWWVSLAFATRRYVSLEAAREILIAARELHPNTATIHFNLGCYACQLGEMEAARKYVLKACQFDVEFKKLAVTDEDLKPLWAYFAGG